MLFVPPAVAAAGRKWEELMRRSPRARVIRREKVRLVLGGGLVAARAMFGTNDTRGVDGRNGRREGTPLYVCEAAITKINKLFQNQ